MTLKHAIIREIMILFWYNHDYQGAWLTCCKAAVRLKSLQEFVNETE